MYSSCYKIKGIAFILQFMANFEVYSGYCGWNLNADLGHESYRLFKQVSFFIGTVLIPSMLLVFGCVATAIALYKRRYVLNSKSVKDKSMSKSMRNLTVTMIIVEASYMICLFPYHFNVMVYTFFSYTKLSGDLYVPFRE